MLDNIKELVRQHAGDAIINNPAIPNEKNDEAVEVASHSILDGLKNAAASGNVSSVVDFFKGGTQAANQSQVADGIQQQVIKGLTGKLGLQSGIATSVAGALIPIVLNKLIHKTNDPADKSFDLQDMLGKITGGKAKDLLGKVTGGEGGLGDKLKGLFN